MKNEDISIHDVVPVEIRREIYNQAIITIQRGKPIAALSSFGLCLILPCILWDLPTFLTETPQGGCWDSVDTRSMFPELTTRRIHSIEMCSIGEDNPQQLRNKQRIKVLTEMLAELETL